MTPSTLLRDILDSGTDVTITDDCRLVVHATDKIPLAQVQQLERELIAEAITLAEGIVLCKTREAKRCVLPCGLLYRPELTVRHRFACRTCYPDPLEAKAVARGLDAYAVMERAAILEYDGDLTKAQAEGLALEARRENLSG
jgi:hypothetical protein